LTVAWLATGTKAGVSTRPWAVVSIPARAAVLGHVPSISKECMVSCWWYGFGEVDYSLQREEEAKGG
jgi:hypothetical protein